MQKSASRLYWFVKTQAEGSSPGPLREGERAWYTPVCECASLQKFSSIIRQIPIAITWSGGYRQCVLSTWSLYFTSIALWSVWAWYFERVWYGRPHLLSYHSKQTFKDPTKPHWATQWFWFYHWNLQVKLILVVYLSVFCSSLIARLESFLAKNYNFLWRIMRPRVMFTEK